VAFFRLQTAATRVVNAQKVIDMFNACSSPAAGMVASTP